MATLEKIRSRAGLLVVVIGLALLAFIIGDFLNSGQSFFMMNQNRVATVNGKTIGVEEFQNRVNARTEQMQAMYQNYGMTLPEGMSAQIQMDVYEQMVNECLLEEEYERLGIAVSDTELQDLLTGENIHAQIAQMFTDPNTGAFDREAMEMTLSYIFNPDQYGITDPNQLAQLEMQRQSWLDLEDQMRNVRSQEKFHALLSASLVPNKIDAEMAYDMQTTSVDVVYALQPYVTIADSTVDVSDSEIQAEYNRVKARYETPEVRRINYIAVDINPSADDYARIEEQVNMLASTFATTQDVASVVNNNSDYPYEDVFVAESTLSADMKNFVDTATVGEATAPFFANEAYTMYRLMAKKTAPDTIKVNVMSFAPGDAAIDSVYDVLVAGGNFDELAATYAADKDVVVTEGMVMQFGREFIADVFAAGDSYFKTKSIAGEHIVKVVERTAPVAKVNVAVLTIGVDPSVDTETNIYNNLSSYVAKYNNAQQFVDSALVAGYATMPAECRAHQVALRGMQNTRQIIHWAFNAEKGDISEIYEIDGRYIVAVVDEIIPEGYVPMEELRNQLTMTVRRDKKAEIISSQLADVTPATIEAYAAKMQSQVDTLNFVSLASQTIAGLGNEPVVAGVATSLEVGAVSAPVKGNRGIYVLKTISENPAARPYDEAAELNRLQQQYVQTVGRFAEVLKEKANIKDTLSRFF